MSMTRRVQLVVFVGILFAGTVGVSADGGSKNAPAANAPQSQGSAPSSSNAPFESQMLAFGALDQISQAIAERACNQALANSTMVVYDQNAFASLQAYQAFNANALSLLNAYQSVLPGADASLHMLSAAPGGGDLMADITNAIATLATATNTNTASAVTIQDNSLALNIMKYLSKSACRDKHVAAVYAPLAGFNSTGNVPEVLELLIKMKHHVQEEIDAKNIKGDQQIKTFTEVNALFDSFVSSLTAVNSGTGQPGMVPIVQGSGLYKLIRKPNTAVLYASVATAGATQRVKKNLITSLITGDWISYSGGSIVNTQLIDAQTGSVYFSDVLRYRTPTTHLKKPSHSEDTRGGDNLGSFLSAP